MFIILPNAVDGIYNLEEQLVKRDLLNLAKRYSVHEVEVSIPRFKSQNSIDFKKILQKVRNYQIQFIYLYLSVIL